MRQSAWGWWGLVVSTVLLATTSANAGPSKKERTKKEPPPSAEEEPHEDAPKVPPQCLRDLNPTGRYELKLTSIPSTEIPVKQCSGAQTGKSLVFVYDVEADPESNFIRVRARTNPDGIIRDARLQRSITDFCKAKNASKQVVTWFSWDEYVPLKNGWSITYKGFGAGDAGNDSVAQRLSLIGMMMDADNMPVCYMNWSSE